ncbi:histidine phosphatase family protein [Levilactobacillus parabrevis]|uniref:histidine phosphatase family protein n=1 Tax=Levilactobacillus parabrevis TaxID=357278 RepID=UPI0021A51935|nr:histidine phosphatase family protein [Levilactobacillus parabrevis]MCT4486857.1 histidine phosphatase family protein [Levilactobacillus parabrevis]
MTTFDWVRHGQTQANVDQIMQGQLDTTATHLTVRGLQQAEHLAQWLQGEHYDQLISSPLHRTRQTTAALTTMMALTPSFDDRLMEADYGEWTGKSLPVISEQRPQDFDTVTGEALPDVLASIGGESYLAIQHRVGQWLAEQVVDHPADHILVVSHGLTIKATALLMLAAPATTALPEPTNTSVTRMVIDPATGHRYLKFYSVSPQLT